IRMETWDVGLCLPGCQSLMGPGTVNGITGGPVSMYCLYEKVYKEYNKYWCQGQYDTTCDIIMETKGEEKEERNGYVTIRDRADNLALLVTMENLNADDTVYWCRIQTVWILDVLSHGPLVQAKVSVSPGKTPLVYITLLCFYLTKTTQDIRQEPSISFLLYL
uniref:Immunoglobulin V-set domain-containing protein n=1 Tax=Loxodonta africana TaxID=9785 RepID=G3TWH1_LOXAF